MRHDVEGRVVEVGARTRTIPPALRRALYHRDQTCRFPGCRGRIREGHHVQHWARGGPTAAVPADPVEAVRAENEARQVRVSARTACALWLGERLDLGWTIDVLHPRATAPAPPIGASD
jgi:hypothetical protein